MKVGAMDAVRKPLSAVNKVAGFGMGVAGGIMGGKLGAIGGTFAGPVGTIGGALAGGVAGDAIGRKLQKTSPINLASNAMTKQRDKMAKRYGIQTTKEAQRHKEMQAKPHAQPMRA